MSSHRGGNGPVGRHGAGQRLGDRPRDANPISPASSSRTSPNRNPSSRRDSSATRRRGQPRGPDPVVQSTARLDA
jgi:hypothetical protein